MVFLLTGLNHRSAPLALREKFAVENPRPLLAKLKAAQALEEAALLSTCNRSEVLVLAREEAAARAHLRGFFQKEFGAEISDAELNSALSHKTGTAAITHVFRVAAALDSMVVGEPQVLGQTKAAYRAALVCGACGPMLSRLYQRAFAAAKRVRTQTRIAEGALSIARVALQLAREIFETLHNKNALLIGAGEMVELALQTLQRSGLAEIHVANRTQARAAALAARFGGEAHGLSALPALLARADIVLSCVGAAKPPLTAPLLRAALQRRKGRPVFAMDMGVPRNISAEAAGLDGVYAYNLDDMQNAADANAMQRRREVQKAEAIVEEEVRRFQGWLDALAAVPTIRALRERAEQTRAREVARGLSGVQLSADARAAVEALTRAIVNKILHAPVAKLRAEQPDQNAAAHLQSARALFALDED